MNDPDPLTTGQVADILGLQLWRVQHLFQRGLIPEPKRFGRYRVFSRADLPAIEAAARKAGYTLKPELAVAG